MLGFRIRGSQRNTQGRIQPGFPRARWFLSALIASVIVQGRTDIEGKLDQEEPFEIVRSLFYTLSKVWLTLIRLSISGNLSYVPVDYTSP